MKKMLLTSLLVGAALPALAETALCGEYLQKMEEALKAEGNYSDEAMKIVKDQTESIPAEQQDAFCQAGIEGLKDSAADSSEEAAEAGESNS